MDVPALKPHCDSTLQAGQGGPSKDFANDAQKRDAAIVVAITTVTLVLAQSDYVGISHVLGDVTLLPAQAEELMKQLQGGLLPMRSKHLAGYRPSPVPCHRRACQWLC